MASKWLVLFIMTCGSCYGHLNILGDLLTGAHDRIHSQVHDTAHKVINGLTHGLNLNFEGHVVQQETVQPQPPRPQETPDKTIIVIVKEEIDNNFKPHEHGKFPSHHPCHPLKPGCNGPPPQYGHTFPHQHLSHGNPPYSNNFPNKPGYQGSNNYPNNGNQGHSGNRPNYGYNDPDSYGNRPDNWNNQQNGNNNYNPNNDNSHNGNGNNYNPSNGFNGNETPKPDHANHGNTNQNNDYNNQNDGGGNYQHNEGQNKPINHNIPAINDHKRTTEKPEPSPTWKPTEKNEVLPEKDKSKEDDEPLFVPLTPNEYSYGGDQINITAPKREAYKPKPDNEDEDVDIDVRFGQ